MYQGSHFLRFCMLYTQELKFILISEHQIIFLSGCFNYV